MEKSKLMRLDEVLVETKMSKTKLYALLGEGRFPPSRPHGGNVVWVREEVEVWIDCLINREVYQYLAAA